MPHPHDCGFFGFSLTALPAAIEHVYAANPGDAVTATLFAIEYLDSSITLPPRFVSALRSAMIEQLRHTKANPRDNRLRRLQRQIEDFDRWKDVQKARSNGRSKNGAYDDAARAVRARGCDVHVDRQAIRKSVERVERRMQAWRGQYPLERAASALSLAEWCEGRRNS